MLRARPSSPTTVLLRLAAFLAAALVVLPGAPAQATADDPTVTWGVRPADVEPHAPGRPNFAYTAAPGRTIEDGLVVTNHGAVPTTLRVYAADAFTTPQGVLDLRRPEETATGVGAWTVVATPEVVLPPGGSAVVPFTLSVPADAEPGDHAGGVVTSLVSARPDGVSVDRRLGARLHLRVDGPLAPEAAVRGVGAVHHGAPDPTTGSVDVTASVVNTGNVRLGGEATVTVTGPFGWAVRTARVEVPELLPGERTTVTATVADVPALLRLGTTVRLDPRLADGSTLGPVATSVTTWAVPWTVLVVLAVTAGVLVLGRWRTAVTRRRVAEAVAAVRAEVGQSPVRVP